MKRILSLIFVLCSATCFAQAATRPVLLNWTASTSSTVTGYSIYKCTVVSPATSCTPLISGTPLATVAGTTYTDQATTQAAYGYSIVANAPACSPTTPITSPCGNSSPGVLANVPVPPQTAGAQNIVVVVP